MSIKKEIITFHNEKRIELGTKKNIFYLAVYHINMVF